MKWLVLSLVVSATLVIAVPGETAKRRLKLPGPAAQDLMLGTWTIQAPTSFTQLLKAGPSVSELKTRSRSTL